MTRFVRNRIIVFIAIAWFAYWLIAPFIARSFFFELINGLLASLSVGVMFSYFPGAWRALRDRPYKLSGGHLLVLGVVLFQAGIVGLFTWSWAFRVLNEPPWMVDNLLRGWLIYLLFIAGILHLMAGDLDHEAMPTRGWLRIGVFVAIGLGIGVVLISMAGT